MNTDRLAQMEREYGSVMHSDVKLILKQIAYCDIYFGDGFQRPVYFASAVDEEGNDYRVMWEITNDEAEDESDACDWDEFTVKAY